MFAYFACGGMAGGERPEFSNGVLVEGEELPAAGSSESEQVIAARKGQGIYREGLLAKWDGACAVTGLAEPALLMASHARPWRGATNKARLDGESDLDRKTTSLRDSGSLVFN